VQLGGERGKKGDRTKNNSNRGDYGMQLARLWRQHLEAGYPRELTGLEIAGTDARALDAEITSCVSALLTHTMRVDDRIERRLTEISSALTRTQARSAAPVAEFCQRLNGLVSAMLTETRAGRG
jgi:hypothetical protein